jgi:hypothetical protein
VILRRRCSDCRRYFHQPFPIQAARADLEYCLTVQPGSAGVGQSDGWRLDVALLDTQGSLVAAVEVRAQHTVDEVKSERLSALVPWVEVKANEVLHSSSWSLLVDRLPNGKCQRCNAVERYGARHRLLQNLTVMCPKSSMHSSGR